MQPFQKTRRLLVNEQILFGHALLLGISEICVNFKPIEFNVIHFSIYLNKNVRVDSPILKTSVTFYNKSHKHCNSFYSNGKIRKQLGTLEGLIKEVVLGTLRQLPKTPVTNKRNKMAGSWVWYASDGATLMLPFTRGGTPAAHIRLGYLGKQPLSAVVRYNNT